MKRNPATGELFLCCVHFRLAHFKVPKNAEKEARPGRCTCIPRTCCMFFRCVFSSLNYALTFLFILQIEFLSRKTYLTAQTMLVELLLFLYFFQCTVLLNITDFNKIYDGVGSFVSTKILQNEAFPPPPLTRDFD
jgi:hypothetical protein